MAANVTPFGSYLFCSVVSYHVEPQILEMLANSDFFGGEWEGEGMGLPLTRELAWLRTCRG